LQRGGVVAIAISLVTACLALGVSSGSAIATEIDEGWIVFTRDPTPDPDYEGGDEELWAMRADGSGQVQLTSNTCADLTPDASPDGRWVAWVERCPTGGVNLFIAAPLVTNGVLSFTSVRNITAFFGGGANRWPQFSPDMTQLAFIRKTSGNFDIWRGSMVPDAQGVPQLVNPVRVVRLGSDPMVEDCCVSWSPDGQKLVWASNVNKSTRSFDLYRIDSNAVEVWDARTDLNGDGVFDPQLAERLTNLPDYEGTPAYDADGTILYRCNCPNPDVYRLDPATGLSTRLTTYLDLDRTPEGYPGGIIYSRKNAGNDEIYAAGSGGESPIDLTNHPFSDRDPTWLPPSTPQPPDTQPPDTAISTPADGGNVPFSTVTVTGSATDDRVVASVRVGIQRASDGQWFQGGSTWGPAPAYQLATLTPGGASTNWSFAFAPVVGGDHTVTAFAVDGAGTQDPSPAARTFRVADPPNQGGPAPPFLTLTFSRLQMSSAVNCVPVGAPLDTVVAPELQRRGLTGTFSLVTSWTNETTRVCGGGKLWPQSIVYGSWNDARTLRDVYGWQAISQSKTYRNITTLSAGDQRDESCGSLPAFTSRGFTRANGMFAYPNNAYTTQIQQDIVSTCFAYGRTYAGSWSAPGGALNTRATTVAPWFQKTLSLGGGKCNNGAQICRTINQTPYASPILLGNTIAGVQDDQWYVLQGYRFVTGSVSGRWDCTGADWSSHWTAAIEDYCWVDYMAILDRIQPGTVVTDPLSVAQAWGRSP
jgi:Tol biopolymer transport system component